MFSSRRSLLSYLTESADRHPERRMLGSSVRWLTTGSVLAIAEHAATALCRLGLCGGKRVVFRCDNTVGSAIVMLALRAAGVVIIPVAPGVEISAAAAYPVISQISVSRFFIVLSQSKNEIIDLYALCPSSGHRFSTDPDAAAFLIYNEQNTFVELTESDLIGCLPEALDMMDYREDDLALSTLPMHHIYGLVLLAGAVALSFGLYYPDSNESTCLLSAIEKEKLTRVNAEEDLFRTIAEKHRDFDLSFVRSGFLVGGAAAESRAVLENELGFPLIPVSGMPAQMKLSKRPPK